MLIRQLGKADATPYHSLRLRMLQLYPDAFTSSYEEDVGKPLSWVEARLVPPQGGPGFVLGACSGDGQIVGSVGLEVEARRKQRHKALLFGMYMAPEHSGRGGGRALVEACLERARRIPGLEQIYLTVTASNERAKRLYENAGFHVFGLEEHALKIDGRYFAKAHMVLRFAEPSGRQEADA